MLRGVCRSRTVHHDRRRSSPVGLASALTSAGRSHPRNAPRAVRPHRTPVHGHARVGVLMVRQAIERAGVRGVAVGPFRETGAAWERRPIGTKITGVSRAQRSASRRRVVRCRPGIVTHTTFAKVPEQRRTASLRSRCTASGTRNVLILAPMERRPRLRAAPIKAICHPSPLCSLRLAAQDVALSRRKQGFESPRERQLFQWVRRVCAKKNIAY